MKTTRITSGNGTEAKSDAQIPRRQITRMR